MTEMLEAYYRMYMDAKPPLGGGSISWPWRPSTALDMQSGRTDWGIGVARERINDAPVP
jgi:hypothetical protein